MIETHRSDETLALFASGALDAATRADVLAHLDRCEECATAVLAANAHLREEALAEQRSRRPWWLAAVAAGVIVALLALPQLLRRPDPMAQLVAAAPASERTIEPRLSGGFPWAPYRGPIRGATPPHATVAQLKFGEVAGRVIESARDEHATGVALLLLDRPDDASARLEAEARASNDAKTWSDLAAARYTAATQLHRPTLLPPALDAADHALHLSPNLPEALFNRALILERMGASAEAKQAWARYREVDAKSAWSREARERQ